MFALSASGWLFWISLAVVCFTFLGYALLIQCLSQFKKCPAPSSADRDLPMVSILICVHNEASRIAARIQNLLATNWPVEKLEIIIISDGSNDTTVSAINQMQCPQVRVISQIERRGKPAGLNVAIASAKGEFVVLADARQEFAPDTIPNLLRHFEEASVGAVSGALFVKGASSSVGEGMDAYWRLEKMIRAAEARWDSCIGCTGAVYAIRRELYQPIPEDTLIDDVAIPMQIALQGYRVLFDADACAFDPQTLEPERERIRKRRTLAGNWQMLFRYPHWLLPWKNRLWWQLISHKYLRLFAPFFLVMLFVSNAALADHALYRALFLGQCVFYASAGLGMLFRGLRTPLLALPAGFVFLNLMTLSGLWYYLRGQHERGWEMARS